MSRALLVSLVRFTFSRSSLFRSLRSSALQHANKLYQQGLLSYPRTESDQYDAAFDFAPLLQMQTVDPKYGSFAQRSAFSFVRSGYRVFPPSIVSLGLLPLPELKVDPLELFQAPRRRIRTTSRRKEERQGSSSHPPYLSSQARPWRREGRLRFRGSEVLSFLLAGREGSEDDGQD